MDESLFKRILTRIVLVPVVSLLLLALLLGFGLRTFMRSEVRVDHSDRVIAHGNRLLSLMVDEETGTRGYLVTHQKLFLDPLNAARGSMDVEFSQLDALNRNHPDLRDKLNQMHATYQEFHQLNDRLIGQTLTQDEVVALLSHQKELMDLNRKQLADFQQAEAEQRASRFVYASLLQGWSLPLLGFAVALVALLITRLTWVSFRDVNRAFVGQVREIRGQRDQIFEREQWLKTTLRSIGDGVIVCDEHGLIDFMNPVSEQLTGWPEAEAKGRPLAEVFRILDEYTREVVESPVEKVRRLGTIVGLANHTVLVRKDQTERSIDDSGAPVCNEAGELIGVVMVFRDNHDKRMAEHSLIRAEKLAATGRLAATIAHEVNNPLEAIVNLLYLAQYEKNPEEIRRFLQLVESEVHRVAHMTRQSLGFYRESVAPASFRPTELVEEVVAFYGGQASRLNIDIQTTLEAEASIVGARGELRQVLSNLIANSIDALGSDGKIAIAVRDTREQGTGPVKGVRIAVADSGKGIPADIKDKVFEPFFTTKADVGTGLGLWVSRELVEKHGGKLRMRSRPGVGTMFLIHLPVERDHQNSSSVPAD